MQITERILKILAFNATYYTTTRMMIQEACLPSTGKDGCVARKLLNELFHHGLINKTHMLVTNPDNGAAAPVYFPSRKGTELLAQELRDDRWLHACTLAPNWQYLHHWCDIAKFHVALDRAVALQQEASVLGFLHEWDVANPGERDPARRYRLFTEISDKPRLVCVPDAAFLLGYCGYKKVYYLEIDRNTSGLRQIAASKTPGYPALADGQLHRRHFPETNVDAISVLSVSPTANRRDALQRAIQPKEGARLWKFLAWTDVRPETLLYEPILRDHEGKAIPLLQRVGGTSP